MSIYHLSVKPVSRRDGRSATAAAAYRSGSRIVDDRTGEIHDYRRKQGVLYTAILTPDGSPIDRTTLWNLAEAAEKRKDARTAREIEIALPHEVPASAQKTLVQDFVKSLVKKYGIAADLAIHAPPKAGDSRNYHAHILLTTRRLISCTLTDKSALEQEDRALKKAGLPSGREQIEELRKTWEAMANRVLLAHGHAPCMDCRTLQEQGCKRLASVHLGPAASAMERRGIATERGELNRQLAKAVRLEEDLTILESLDQGIEDVRQKAKQWMKDKQDKENREQAERQEQIERKRRIDQPTPTLKPKPR